MSRKEQLEAELKAITAAHDELATRLNSADSNQKQRLWDAVDAPIRSALQNLLGKNEALPSNLADRILRNAIEAIYGADTFDLLKKL